MRPTQAPRAVRPTSTLRARHPISTSSGYRSNASRLALPGEGEGRASVLRQARARHYLKAAA